MWPRTNLNAEVNQNVDIRTDRRTDRRTSSIHKPELLCNPAINPSSFHCHTFGLLLSPSNLKKKSFGELGPLIDPFLPRPGSTPGQSLPKSLKQVQDHEYFISTKFRRHPPSGSVGKADYVFKYIYTYFAPPWIRPWVDLVEKQQHLLGIMITLSLPSLIKIH